MRKGKVLIEQVKGSRIRYIGKSFVAIVLNIFYHIILLWRQKKDINRKYKVSICCIFKNEGKYLKEWLEFHLLIGIEHFYLYNNFSDDNYLDQLDPYITKGNVTLIDWPVKQGQLAAYKHWQSHYRNETEWISFLDLDEFICPYYEKNIYDWIKRFKKYPSVVMYWKMFGTAGIIDPDPFKLVTEQYTISWDRFHFLGKVFCNTQYEIISNDSTMHHLPKCKMRIFNFNIAIPPINEFKRFIIMNIHRFGLNKTENFSIQINHYYSKSYSEFLEKQKKGDVFFVESPNTYDFFRNYEMRNATSDYKIYRYLLELKFAQNK